MTYYNWYKNVQAREFWVDSPVASLVRIRGILGDYNVEERRGVAVAKALIGDEGYNIGIEAILNTEIGRKIEELRKFRLPIYVCGMNRTMPGHDSLRYVQVHDITPVGEKGGLALAGPFAGGELAFPRRDVGMLALLSQTITEITERFGKK